MSLVIFSTDRRTVLTPGADHPPFTLKSHQRPNTSLINLLSDLWTARAPGPDRPQSNLSAQARETISLDDFFKTHADCLHPRGGPSAVRPSSPNRAATSGQKNELYLWTVRLTGPDCPPVTSFSHKLININSNTFSFANVPTPPREQHHVHVC